MADARPSIENIFCCDKLPLVLVISYKMEHFSWVSCIQENTEPFVGEKLDTAMYPNNLIDKYAVAIFQECLKHVVGYLPVRNSGKFANNVFYLLKVDKENSCRAIVHGKAVNQKDDLDHIFFQIYLIVSKILALFFFQVERVFGGTYLFVFPFSNFSAASYFNFKLFYLCHIFPLSCHICF